ncbi:MAG TPA: hypothetical protein VHG28_17925 [Longimicrobiaceae bacterium]|nr:hypothetical protein [Longimicrobiaceae bacterium]
MAANTRVLRYVGWTAAGILFVLTVVILAALILTQTNRGRERILGFTLERLGKGIRGTLVVERIDGNLLTGAKLRGVSLRGENGEPFILADSAYLDYDPRTLTTPRIQIDQAVLYNPEIYVYQLPGDTLWNYQKLFPPGEKPGPERYTLLGRVRLVNASARVELPWEPEEGLTPRQRQREIALALADTSPVVVRRVPGGYLRTITLSGVDGRLSGIRFAPGTRAGSYFGVDSLAGTVRFFRTPFRLERMQGEIQLVENRVEFRAPVVDFADSRVSTLGVITLGRARGEEPRYDVVFDTDSIALRDLRWLYPRFPRDARGGMSLLVETRPEGTLFRARDFRLRAPGTRVRGEFGMIVGDTVRFVDVNLRADPLRMATVEHMLPDSLPVRGLVISGVEIRGPQRAVRPRS